MILIFIGLIIILLLYNFNKAVNKDIIEIKNDGGLENKYFHLITTLKNEYGMNVTNRTNTSVTLSIRDRGVYVEFYILKSISELNIFWTMKNIVSSHNLKWNFKADANQQFMIDSIELSIDNFNEKFINDLRVNSPFFRE